MAPFETLLNELTGFLGINALLEMYKTGNYQQLLTFNGILGAISPVIPFLLLIEIGRALVSQNSK